MKTRINVVVRLRPLLPAEINEGESSNFVQVDEESNVVK